ncbi:DUF1684 domain-containing protein [Streptomyces sp. VRA16 Mangrove soil]|uniref:DUF1684 domain-containing protein n=1 Tax=Streptomyces sp. VRA16 Mangrove soil TaxID=2817434 RepID=UPI001A9E21A8|nr:DUF1684 domain-containing protein [Streptomyces sp. VRA16 Mangrove soil]MBO1331974.1 DUF1684 domain-containing protein [Streptomyces sp. VRA16 Mangrove soil]
MTDAIDTGTATDAWKQWHEERTASVSAPYGPLSLTGTHWLDDHPDGRLPAIPGQWRVDGDAVVRTVDGVRTRYGADATVPLGERRLVVIVREGLWGVRDFDPAAPARTAFLESGGIDATPYDPRWSADGRFTPYEDGPTAVRVENADGRHRALGLAGELAFTLAGQRHTLQVARQGDGRLWAVFADATSGHGSYRFRFLYAAAPDADGRTTVDLNRATLPPCAFADHFVCPFPPPGNTLPVDIAAGERNLTAAPTV